MWSIVDEKSNLGEKSSGKLKAISDELIIANLEFEKEIKKSGYDFKNP